ncbi:MAG: HDOD domain-containing protein [Gemmatimonadaceae bacterium]
MPFQSLSESDASQAPSSTIASPPDSAALLAIALQRVCESHEFPAFSRQMSELLACLDSDERSAQNLANAVLRDYSLTLKVVRTANSVHYNRGQPVRSVTHAMMLLGVGTVRSLATGLLLFEHYRSRGTGLKELLLLSLLTANHAREAALRLGLTEPEMAHLCGMCRNIGELLVACHFPSAYTTIGRVARERLARADRDRTAARRVPIASAAPVTLDLRAATAAAAWQVLGFSFEDLAEAVLAHWGMPGEVRQAVRASGRSGETPLQAVAAFGHDVTMAVYRSAVIGNDAPPGSPPTQATGEADAAGAARAVLARHGDRLRLSAAELGEVLSAAVTETRAVFVEAGISVDAVALAERTAAVLSGNQLSGAAPPPPPPRARLVARPGTDARTAGPPPADPEALTEMVELRERLLAEVGATVPPEHGHALHHAMLVVLEALMRGAPADRALFCLFTPDRQQLEARLGLGEGSEKLVAQCRLPMRRLSGATTHSLARGQDVVLHDGRGAALEEARWVRALGARRVRLMPIVVDGTTIGCLYTDTIGGGESPDGATLAFLGQLRTAAVQAISQRQASAAATPTAPAATPAAAVHRRDIVLRLLRGESAATLSAELGVPEEALEVWKQSFLDGALAGLRGPMW